MRVIQCDLCGDEGAQSYLLTAYRYDEHGRKQGAGKSAGAIDICQPCWQKTCESRQRSSRTSERSRDA